jgi:hypothetical protein
MADQNEEPLFNFSADEFERLMETQGLENTTRAIVEESNDMMGGNRMTYESLRDGTAPILDVLPGYSGIDPAERKLSDEAILNLFTNVEDYGKYDPGSTGEGAGYEALKTGALRAAPEAIAGGGGFSLGVRAAAPVAAYIPPAGLPGLAAKGVVLLGGGLIGAIGAGFAANEAEEAVFGEKAPVMPSLEAADRFGETLMYGVSMLHAPWTLVSKGATEGAQGSVQFLENFKNVASGQFARNADDAAELTARNAGLTERQFRRAQAAQAAAQAGPRGRMFSRTGGGYDLGIFKFNPKGFFFNPVKGPIGARAAAGLEQGVSASLQGARQRPLRFMTIEAGAASGAGLGAVVAQNLDPYDEGTRFISELAGSALVPISLQLMVEKGPEGAMKLFRTMQNWASSEKRAGILQGRMQNEAGKRILAALRESSEYVDAEDGEHQIELFIESLMTQAVNPDGTPAPGTVKDLAVAFGMPMNATVSRIQEQLERASQELSVATARGRDQMLTAAKSTIADLINTGDPQAMALAARLQQGIFEQNIADQIEIAVKKLYDSAKRVIGDSPDAGSQQVDLSRKLYEVLNKQITASKSTERNLWGAVGDFPITTFVARNGREMGQPNLLLLLDKPATRGGLKMSSNAGQERLNSALGPLQKDIDEFRDYFSGGGGKNPVTSQTLVEMRGVALDKAAELRKQGKIQAARNMDMVADAILRDLTGQKNSDNKAYNAARAYTYARNNVFTRSFLGDMQTYGKDRALTMNPDELAARLLQGNNRATLSRIEEINTAGRFGLQHFLDDAALNNVTTQETIDLVIRDSLRQVMDRKPVIDPITKQPTGEMSWQVNPSKLENWRKQPGTQELFSVFPQLARDLASAEDAQRLYAATASDITNLGKSPQTVAFQTVLEFQDKPAAAVGRALSSKAPAKAMQNLVELANSAGRYVNPETGEVFTKEDALMGLRNAIFDYATIHSGGSGLSFSPTRFEDQLFAQTKGVSQNTPFNLISFMKRNDMITDDEVDKIQRAVKQMRGVEEAFHTGDLENVLFKNPSLAKTFYARVLGATFGQKVQEQLNSLLGRFGLGTTGGGIGGGMVAAETGSTAIQQLLLRGPESQTVKTMSNLFANPELLGPLLKEVRDKESADSALKALETGFAGLSRRVGRRLPYSLRYVTETEDTTPVPPQEPAPAPTPAPTMPPPNQRGSLNPLPSSLPTLRGGPSPSPVQQAAAAPTPTPQVPSGPVDRARFAALFPEDPISQLMRQGVGSLQQ